jgi:hypothetical protein
MDIRKTVLQPGVPGTQVDELQPARRSDASPRVRRIVEEEKR